jgi:hypothetical protein
VHLLFHLLSSSRGAPGSLLETISLHRHQQELEYRQHYLSVALASSGAAPKRVARALPPHLRHPAAIKQECKYEHTGTQLESETVPGTAAETGLPGPSNLRRRLHHIALRYYVKKHATKRRAFRIPLQYRTSLADMAAREATRSPTKRLRRTPDGRDDFQSPQAERAAGERSPVPPLPAGSAASGSMSAAVPPALPGDVAPPQLLAAAAGVPTEIVARAADSSAVANGSTVVANGGIAGALISPDFVQQLASSLGPLLFPSLQ